MVEKVIYIGIFYGLGKLKELRFIVIMSIEREIGVEVFTPNIT
jgi:hypothetical protein